MFNLFKRLNRGNLPVEDNGKMDALEHRLNQIGEGLAHAHHRINISDERVGVIRYGLDRVDQLVQVSNSETPKKSYSYEAEDLAVENIYSNILKRFKPGFYLDIGAAHPINFSNTYLLYRLGWTGVCVEPNPVFHALYKEHRPHDTALNVGLAAKSGTLTYHQFDYPYINGFYGQDHVNWQIKSNGQNYIGKTDITCMSVADFVEQFGNRPIDFLNIDVEALDAEILAAWDWRACSPTIVCAEIVATDLHDIVGHEITKILERQGYSPVCRHWHSTIFVKSDELRRSRVAGQEEAYSSSS